MDEGQVGEKLDETISAAMMASRRLGPAQALPEESTQRGIDEGGAAIALCRCPEPAQVPPGTCRMNCWVSIRRAREPPASP